MFFLGNLLALGHDPITCGGPEFIWPVSFFRNTEVKNRNLLNYEKFDVLNFRNCNYWTANQKGCYNIHGVVLISTRAKTLWAST
jgi:hypothetical protein